jgi:hypothetical protein
MLHKLSYSFGCWWDFILFYSCCVEQDIYFGTGGLDGQQTWNFLCWLCAVCFGGLGGFASLFAVFPPVLIPNE